MLLGGSHGFSSSSFRILDGSHFAGFAGERFVSGFVSGTNLRRRGSSYPPRARPGPRPRRGPRRSDRKRHLQLKEKKIRRKMKRARFPGLEA